MLKLSYEEFIEEIKGEMYGYEEITETDIEKWFTVLDDFTSKEKKSGLLTYSKDGIQVTLKDEADLFMVVDKYLAAIVNDELDKYFDQWSI